MTGPSPYCLRDARAAHLAGERPHASQILHLYREVLARQGPLYERAKALRWVDAGVAALPWDRLEAPFRRFLDAVIPAVPAPLSAAGHALAAASEETRGEVLRRTLQVGEMGELAGLLGVDLLQLTFWSRGFLEPLAVAAARCTAAKRDGDAHGDRDARGTCPHCGWPAQVAVLGDEGDRRGGRSLVCALCATAWPFPRLRCPSCGESGSGELVVHTADGLPHVRVEECKTCRAYWKTVDLRQDGRAVPVVEDLATPELDVWAGERDLWKVCRNLLAM